MARLYIPLFVSICLAGWASLPAHATKTIFKCIHAGQVILADHPCEAASPDEASATAASVASPIASWTGDVELRGNLNGRELARSVAAFKFEALAEGKIRGASAANGCKVIGSWSHTGKAREIAIEVVLSGCHTVDFNRSYSGLLLLSGSGSSADLALTTSAAPEAGRNAAAYSISGSLHR